MVRVMGADPDFDTLRIFRRPGIGGPFAPGVTEGGDTFGAGSEYLAAVR